MRHTHWPDEASRMNEQIFVPAYPNGVYAVVPAIGALVLINLAAYVWLRGSRDASSKQLFFDIAWCLPSFGILIALACAGFTGHLAIPLCYLALNSCIMLASGALALVRRRVLGVLEHAERRQAQIACALRDGLVLVAVTVLSFFMLEVPWNTLLFELKLSYVIINLVLIAIPYIILYVIGNRRGSVLLIPLATYAVMGIAQFFVAEFKSSAILPSDLLALGTALSVSGGYSFVLSVQPLIALSLAAVAASLLSLMRPLPRPAELGKRPRVALTCARIAAGCVIIALVGALSHAVSLCRDFGLQESFWDALTVYRSQGFAASFVSLIQNARIEAPEGYSASEAQRIFDAHVEQYQASLGSTEARAQAEAQFQEVSPSVVVIMNESFSDLSIFGDLGAGYAGPQRLKSIDDALYTGNVYASIVGGGTCNSEFEFLTGIPMHSIGVQNQPYMMYNLSDTSSVAKQFAQFGYQTTAIHPQPATNWNRESVYQELGFDEFLDISDFDPNSEVIHAGMSDAVTYEKILEVLQENEGPQFVFDVTMQNHGGYDAFDMPEDTLVPHAAAGIDEATSAQLTEYLALIEESDRELEAFIEQLRMLDRPVVLVFFGDHQPSISPTLNDVLGYATGAEGVAHVEQQYQTPYLIWANYDVAGNDQVSERRDMGIYTLSSLMKYAIGAPLTDLQCATLDVMQQVPILNGFGYQTADGTWHEFDAQLDQSARDLEWMVYLKETGRL